MPGSLQILVSSFFIFGNLSCEIFFTMVSVCKARQTRLLKNANKHFLNFVGQNQQKTEMEWKVHSSLAPFPCTFLSRPFPFRWKKRIVVVFAIDAIQFVTISFVYVKNHLDSLWSVCQLMVWKSENRVAVLTARAHLLYFKPKSINLTKR
mgnify:CR=1 FL=1